MNARQISDFSHTEWGWLGTDTSEDIGYHTAWFSTEPLTEEQYEIGVKVAQRNELMA